MSVKIRLRRMGKKKQPHYRIVVADSRSPRDGRFVENLGYYSPLTNPARLVLDLERVDYWVSEGAITSPTVGNLVTKARAGGDDTVAFGVMDAEEQRAAREEARAAKRAAKEAAVAAAAAGEAEAEAEAAEGDEASAEAADDASGEEE